MKKDFYESADWFKKMAEQPEHVAEATDALLKTKDSENWKFAFDRCVEVVNQYPAVANNIGRMYYHGKGVEKNLYVAAEWMRKAVDGGVKWAPSELFDILWDIGSPESYEDMISIVSESAKKGDFASMGRLGRAYYHGKGVEKNLYVAAEWMRKAVDGGVKWAPSELFDILWDIGSPESYEDMISIVSESAKKGDFASMGRLGRAYYHGKGVEKNLYVAAEWMRKAVDGGVKWAPRELFDILWGIGSPESYEDMISIVSESAKKGDFASMGRLGRAYYHGKGVEKNLYVAAEWMRKAVDGGVKWAPRELFDILWGIGNLNGEYPKIPPCTNFLDVVTYLDSLNQRKILNAMSKVASIYYNGNASIEQNYSIALSWMEWAIDLSVLSDNDILNPNTSYSKLNKYLSKRDFSKLENQGKNEFFHRMPITSGELRLLQICSVILMREFDKICKDHGLTYWSFAGTLLGAVRHQGFIPWDDDLDVGMFRHEIHQLKDIVEKLYPNMNLREEYRIYDGPHHIYNMSFKGYGYIFRIDIFIFDAYKATTDSLEKIYRRDRKKLCNAATKFRIQNELEPGALLNDNQIKELEKIISEYRISYNSKEIDKTTSATWGIDNLTIGETSKSALSLTDILPLKDAMFENIPIKIPKNSDLMLRGLYGNYNTIPNDAFTHRHNNLTNEKIIKLKAIIDKYYKDFEPADGKNKRSRH
ncbi:MAG: LicD family protein [Candidatus Methanomethylophilaceae archaeon]